VLLPGNRYRSEIRVTRRSSEACSFWSRALHCPILVIDSALTITYKGVAHKSCRSNCEARAGQALSLADLTGRFVHSD
jgi:hypothetical protein